MLSEEQELAVKCLYEACAELTDNENFYGKAHTFTRSELLSIFPFLDKSPCVYVLIRKSVKICDKTDPANAYWFRARYAEMLDDGLIECLIGDVHHQIKVPGDQYCYVYASDWALPKHLEVSLSELLKKG